MRKSSAFIFAASCLLGAVALPSLPALAVDGFPTFVDVTKRVGRGFGDRWNRYAWSMLAYKDAAGKEFVYVGTWHSKFKISLAPLEVFDSKGAELWRYSLADGKWTKIIEFGGFERENVGFRNLALYNGLIYAGTVNSVHGNQLYWISPGGGTKTWGKVNVPLTFQYPNTSVRGMVVFDGKLYIGTENDAGGELWVFDGTGMALVHKFPQTDSFVSALRVFNGKLYIGTWGEGPRLYRLDPGNTIVCVTPTNPEVQQDEGTMTLAELKGKLFLGTLDLSSEEFSLLHSATPDDPGSWTVVTTTGFGQPSNDYAWSMQPFTYKGRELLFLGTFNSGFESGSSSLPMDGLGQLWTSEDGDTWTMLVSNGFDNRYNWGFRTMAVAGGRLFVGTASSLPASGLIGTPGGCQVWASQ